MVRISKQAEKRNRSPRRHKAPSVKTGPKKASFKLGYKPHENSLEGLVSGLVFIPKIH